VYLSEATARKCEGKRGKGENGNNRQWNSRVFLSQQVDFSFFPLSPFSVLTLNFVGRVLYRQIEHNGHIVERRADRVQLSPLTTDH
jgi:hypothetical protein